MQNLKCFVYCSRGSTPSIGTPRDSEAGPRPNSGNGGVVDWVDAPIVVEVSDKADGDKKPSKIRWKKGELLGVGAFGKVFLGLNLDSGELMAVKVIPVTGGTDGDEYTEELIREISLMKVLFNEHIVRYIGTERDDSHLFIFLEYVPGGSIASVVHKFGKFGEALVKAYTRQILVGLAYLHDHEIMHRDIKGANILISNDGVIKLADFGASKRITEMMTQNDCMSLKGTPYWMAPEVIMQSGHGRSADIWSVGCTVIEMMTGKPPFSEFPTQVSVLFHIANTQEPPTIPEDCSEQCKEFLLQCFQRNPRERPTAATLLGHPFVGRGMDSPMPRPPQDPSLPSSPAVRTPAGIAPEFPNIAPSAMELPPVMVKEEAGRGINGHHQLVEIKSPEKDYKQVVNDIQGGHKMADEQIVRDYLYQQVREQDGILEDDLRHSLKLLTNKSKKTPGRRSAMSPLTSPAKDGSPLLKRRPTPDYGVLAGQPPIADSRGIALGEKPIQSKYHEGVLAKSDHEESQAEKAERKRAEKERLWQEDLERERRFQEEQRGRVQD